MDPYIIILTDDNILSENIKVIAPGILIPETIIMSKSIIDNEPLKIDLKITEDYEYISNIYIEKDSMLACNTLLIVPSTEGFSSFKEVKVPFLPFEIKSMTISLLTLLFEYATYIKKIEIDFVEFLKDVSFKKDLFTYTEFIVDKEINYINDVLKIKNKSSSFIEELNIKEKFYSNYYNSFNIDINIT